MEFLKIRENEITSKSKTLDFSRLRFISKLLDRFMR